MVTHNSKSDLPLVGTYLSLGMQCEAERGQGRKEKAASAFELYHILMDNILEMIQQRPFFSFGLQESSTGPLLAKVYVYILILCTMYIYVLCIRSVLTYIVMCQGHAHAGGSVLSVWRALQQSCTLATTHTTYATHTPMQ